MNTNNCWLPIFDVVASEPYRRPAPLTPAALARLVARKRFTSKKGDLPMVIALNTRTILSIFRDMKVVKYASIDWGDDEVVQLAEVLPLCTSATELSLANNKNISVRGAKALAAAFAEGAMSRNMERPKRSCGALRSDPETCGGVPQAGLGLAPLPLSLIHI